MRVLGCCLLAMAISATTACDRSEPAKTSQPAEAPASKPSQYVKRPTVEIATKPTASPKPPVIVELPVEKVVPFKNWDEATDAVPALPKIVESPTELARSVFMTAYEKWRNDASQWERRAVGIQVKLNAQFDDARLDKATGAVVLSFRFYISDGNAEGTYQVLETERKGDDANVQYWSKIKRDTRFKVAGTIVSAMLIGPIRYGPKEKNELLEEIWEYAREPKKAIVALKVSNATFE